MFFRYALFCVLILLLGCSPEVKPSFALTITHVPFREGVASDLIGVSTVSGVEKTTAQILIRDEGGNLIPCNYQMWLYAENDAVGSGNNYIPSGKPIAAEDIVLIRTDAIEHKPYWDFNDFVRGIMRDPPPEAQFITYDGCEEELIEGKTSFFGTPRMRFVHRFSFYKLRAS